MAYKRMNARDKRKRRIRKRINGTAERPRMSVFRSNTNIYVQLIDDVNGKTLVSASTLKEEKKANKEGAAWLGKSVAEKATTQKIETVVFDRSGYQFHGVIKEVADAARAGGLKF